MSSDDNMPAPGVAEDPAKWGIEAAYLRNKADPAGSMERARAWAEKNAEAIEAYNRLVAEYGVIGDDLRTW